MRPSCLLRKHISHYNRWFLSLYLSTLRLFCQIWKVVVRSVAQGLLPNARIAHIKRLQRQTPSGWHGPVHGRAFIGWMSAVSPPASHWKLSQPASQVSIGSFVLRSQHSIFDMLMVVEVSKRRERGTDQFGRRATYTTWLLLIQISSSLQYVRRLIQKLHLLLWWAINWHRAFSAVCCCRLQSMGRQRVNQAWALSIVDSRVATSQHWY